MVVVFNPQDALRNVAKLYAEPEEKDYYAGILNTDNDTLAAIFCFDNYIPKVCIDMHWHKVNGGAFLTRRTLKDLFAYPFEYAKVNKVNAKIPQNLDNVVSLAKRVGFYEEGVLRKCAFNGADLWFGGMFKHECRWL